jgi:Resolvase, N terminal domain
MRRAVLYLRVSTIDQTTANQERELRQVADRMGVEVVKVYRDHGISGAKGRDKRPQFDALMRLSDSSTSSRHGRSIGWDAPFWTLLASSRKSMLSRSIFICTSKDSTRRRRPAKPCSR